MKSGRIRRRSLLTFVAVALLVMPVLATRAGAQESDRPVLRFGVNAADRGSLDPHFASGTQDRTVVDMLFNGLVRFKPGDSSVIEPDLAAAVPEPTMEGETQVWTVTLRDGVMCHPWEGGAAYELTADDVVYSLQKSANLERSGYSGEYAGMTFEKVDDVTVRIVVETPLSPTLFLPKIANYAGGYIVCAQAVEALGDEGFAGTPVGTGPFVFDSYTAQTNVMLTANEAYFRGAPQLGGVDVRYLPDSTSRELALASGELDVAAGLPEAQWVERINSEGNLQADVFGVGESIFVNFNIENEFLANPLVRQAIAHAIDREEHLALFGPPVAELEHSVVPAQLTPGGLTSEQVAEAGVEYPFDLERARQLMEEAGYPDGFSLTLVTSEMSDYRSNYEVLQAELGEIGIELEIQVIDHATMHEQIRQDVNPIVIYVAARPNAQVYLDQFFFGGGAGGERPVTNFSHYTAIDDLIEQARAATDAAAQEDLWRQANVQILTDLAAYPLVYKNLVYARAQNVDYGHELVSVFALYPGVDETTTITS